MGIKSFTRYADVRQLSEEVDRVRQDMDRTITELTAARDQLPDVDRLRALFAFTPPDERRDVSDACIGLELALEDARRGAHRLADKAREWHDRGPDAAPGADQAACHPGKN